MSDIKDNTHKRTGWNTNPEIPLALLKDEFERFIDIYAYGQFKPDFDDYKVQVRWEIIRRNKVKELYPDYWRDEPCRNMDQVSEHQFVDENGDFIDSRENIINAVICNGEMLSYSRSRRFSTDSEILLAMVVNNRNSFYCISQHFNFSRFTFLSDDILDGNCYSEDDVEPLKKLIELVAIEKPIAEFYESIRPVLSKTKQKMTSKHIQDFLEVSKLPQFDEVIEMYLENDLDNDLKSSRKCFDEIKTAALHFKMDIALALKNEPPRKVQKI